jgi:hypothetical protein
VCPGGKKKKRKKKKKKKKQQATKFPRVHSFGQILTKNHVISRAFVLTEKSRAFELL